MVFWCVSRRKEENGVVNLGVETKGRYTSSSFKSSEGCFPEEGYRVSWEVWWEKGEGEEVEGQVWVPSASHCDRWVVLPGFHTNMKVLWGQPTSIYSLYGYGLLVTQYLLHWILCERSIAGGELSLFMLPGIFLFLTPFIWLTLCLLLRAKLKYHSVRNILYPYPQITVPSHGLP